MKIKINSFVLLFFTPFIIFAQQELLPLKPEANIIRNATSLKLVFEKLAKANSSKISFFHMGDSHIQADYFTSEIRNQLQQVFGNAGRGLVFPYRLIPTNGPADYGFKSVQKWESKKLVKPNGNAFCGLSGYTLLLDPKRKNYGLDFYFKKDSGTINNATQNIEFIYETMGEEPEISAYDAQSLNYSKLLNRYKNSNLVKDSFVFNEPIGQIDINIHTNSYSQVCCIDAILLSNPSNGLIYHSMGVNGAKFWQYNNAPKFIPELALLKPQLVIISLGTNESAGDYDSLTFIETVDSLVNSVKAIGSAVLITTPANNYLAHRSYKYIIKKGKKRRVKIKTYEHNEQVKAIKDNLLAYCDNKNIACWDLYEVMGGDYSMKQWVSAGKAAKDHMHFSKGAYILQGQLFSEAFMAAYKQYQLK